MLASFLEFVVVHNGIITNHKDIRKFLVSSYFCVYICIDYF